MSDIRVSPGIDLQPIELLPHQIHTLARFNVRPFSAETGDAEDRRIAELAAGIEAVGQLDALLVTPDYTLIAGHRRRKAVIVINERRSARGQSLLKLRCAIDRSGGDLRRKSIISNLHRKDASPMDLAYLITQIRKEYNWVGNAGAEQVARYLGVDRMTILQHERFLCAEKEFQNRIHEGVISAQSALDILRETNIPKEQEKLVKRATEIQAEDRLDKTLSACQQGKLTINEATRAMNEPAKTRISHPSIIKAIREHHATTHTGKRLLLSRKELVAAMTELADEARSVSAADFARYFALVYAHGEGTKQELKAKFRAIGIDYKSAASQDLSKKNNQSVAS